MKKSAKVSLALALMMGVVGGAQIANMNTASAEISDKFRMEMNGVISYKSVNDTSSLDSYSPKKTKTGEASHHYWSNYYRVVLNYYQDKNVSAQFRLHSGYDTAADYARNTNYQVKGYGAQYGSDYNGKMYMDRAYIQIKDPVAKTTYVIGKSGSYMGQGMVFNSTGNHTGASVQIGNWWEPNNIGFYWWDGSSGKREHAVNAQVGIAKNVKLTALYFDASTSKNEKTELVPKLKWNKRTKQHEPVLDKETGLPLYEYKTTYPDSAHHSHILSWGLNAKMPAVTLVGEYAHNLVGSNVSYGDKKMSGDRKAWYVEAYTGPTSDMTSGLPLQKPGTSVWSLKYQDIGANSTVAHNPTFIDNVRGFRLTYGHTFRKGLSGDIAWGRYKEKYVNQKKNSWDNIIVGEVSFKFK